MMNSRQVQLAKPKDKAYKLTDGDGLYLYIAKTGNKTWRYNYAYGGKQKTKSYGRYPSVSLADARRLHIEFKESGVKGSSNPTFSTVMQEWLPIHLAKLSNEKHKKQVESTLYKYAIPYIGDTKIQDIPKILKK